MKRVGNLWPELTSFANLLAAAEAAAAGKRKRPDVAAFLMNLEPELMRLRRELLNGSYAPRTLPDVYHPRPEATQDLGSAVPGPGCAPRADEGSGADFRTPVFQKVLCVPRRNGDA
jgi:hypothetical protein